MTTTTTNADNSKKPARKERRHNQHQPPQNHPRRSVKELLAYPPKGWTTEVLELSADTEARKRPRLLVLRGEYGWRALFFTTVKVMKKTSSPEGTIEVSDDLDLLPQNVIESALEVNLFTDDVLENMIETLAGYYIKQRELPPPHKRPVTQRPFEGLREMLGKEEDMAKKQPQPQAKKKSVVTPTASKTPRRLVFRLLLGG